MRRKIFIGAFVLALAGFCTIVSAGERKLTGDEIKTALNGKTVVGTNDSGIQWKQSFNENGGTLYELTGAGPQNGYWEVRGDQFCSQWPPDAAWVCYDMTGENDSVTFISDSGKLWPSKVLP
ncbi:MAG TPA: hypothetical protein VMZ01_06190 [Aestuariivirga sp.]|nr:hypothetical protein [Aestuariivirga sp.]